ncbi:MAG: M23 family metallopeptidase [Pseudobdellovibrionaceae bacterium]
MNSFTSAGAQCRPVPVEAPNSDFILPFDSKTVAVCTHSSGSGSHSSSNAFYALDLATNYSKPAAIVRASAEGVAYVFGADPNGMPCSSDPNVICQLCPEPQGTPANAQPSDCGQSWGNHIRVLHSNGYVSFYVHLDHPIVKSGTFVHRGDPIGVEGWTGAAGHRHVHWSIQAPNGNNETDWINHISWAGQSVPFRFTAKQDNQIKNFNAANINCAHAGIGQAPAVQQPQFSGIQ